LANLHAASEPWRERLREEWRRRAVALGVALALEAVFLALLLSMGIVGSPEPTLKVVDFKTHEVAADTPPEPEPDKAPKASPAPPSDKPPPPNPASPSPAQPAPAAPAAAIPVPPVVIPRTAPPVAAAPAKAGVVLRNDMSGPPDTGTPGDTQRVGTAPNGEPMYAAAWYRKPTPQELDGYLSTATGPGWGLIACKTVPDFRVEDCVGLDEYPEGSNFIRAVLAAAWQFRVRPPFKGGQALVGSWVRIRIEQTIQRR
jgi:protein TonB